jgi:hypothetical protein
VFHLEHYPNNNRKATPRKMNPMAITTRFDTDKEDWGHPDLKLEMVRAEQRAPIPRRESVRFPKTSQEAFPLILSDTTKAALGKCWDKFPGKDRHGKPATQPNARLCLALAWLVGKIQPNVFLNLFGGRPDAVVVVANLMPTCSQFLVETAAAGFFDIQPMQSVLSSAPHKGHAQFIGGDIADLLPRLDGILVSEKIDLIFADVQGGAAPSAPEAILVGAAKRLSARGALLFIALSDAQFVTLRSALLAVFPLKRVLALGDHIGLLAGDEAAP